jgi:hypothetical protein
MLMQAVLSCDERAMEAEESFITTIIVTTSPPYEQFKLHNFHLLVLLVRSELRCDEALPFQVVVLLRLQITAHEALCTINTCYEQINHE